MNHFFQALTDVFATVLRVLLWGVAGLAALSVALMLMLGLALAGAWAMLTGRRTWWTQLRHMQSMRGNWMGAKSSADNAAANDPAQHGTGATTGARASATGSPRAGTLNRRRFRVQDVSDVMPREVHG